MLHHKFVSPAAFFTQSSRFAVYLAAAAVMWLVPNSAHGGEIAGVSAVGGPGLGDVTIAGIITISPSNDEQPGGPGGDNNVTVPFKRFDNVGYIDIVFDVSDTNGVTEYLFTESVDNNTFVNWSRYIMQLGFETGDNFRPSAPGDGLSFDAPEFNTSPTSTVFATVVTSEDVLVFENGIHDLAQQVYTFRIDVPDGIRSFTIRQTPVAVPEPGTLLLAAVAAVGMLPIVRRARRFGR
jgi:hypothetical protein